MNNSGEKDAIMSRSHSEEKNSYKLEKLLNPWALYPRLGSKVFLASCVVGVLIDPLFLYVLVIDEDKKCVAVDRNMKVIALVLRSATDFSYVLHIMFRLGNAIATAEELKASVFTGIPWLYLFIDVLAILPLPQVIILKYFSKLAGSRSLITRKILNFLLLIQYVPRLFRVHLSATDLGKSFDSLTRGVWVRGAFIFFLYLSFGHIFGALWYFYAIFRETACWHHACESLKGCRPSSFDCRMPNPIKNITYLNNFCPVNPPNENDFGLFLEAVKSGILANTYFPRKFARCFWWGLRNLSSFGQNLETSGNTQENMFAILISILGLLLFLYLIGNLQTYIQFETQKAEEARRLIELKQPEIDDFLSSHSLPERKRKVIEQYLRRTIRKEKDFDIKFLQSLLEEGPHLAQNSRESLAAWLINRLGVKKLERRASDLNVDMWITKNEFTPDMKKNIKHYVRLRSLDRKDVDVGNILPILPSEIGMSFKKQLCFPMLKKLPLLQNMDEIVYESFCKYLKPVIYEAKSYIIRKNEPLDFILLVTLGVVWCFGGSTAPMECLERGGFHGNELLEWKLGGASYAQFPISGANLKCHNKVEAFALMAEDLDNVLRLCWSEFSRQSQAKPEGIKPFAAASLKRAFQRFVRKKKSKNNQLSIVTV